MLTRIYIIKNTQSMLLKFIFMFIFICFSITNADAENESTFASWIKSYTPKQIEVASNGEIYTQIIGAPFIKADVGVKIVNRRGRVASWSTWLFFKRPEMFNYPYEEKHFRNYPRVELYPLRDDGEWLDDRPKRVNRTVTVTVLKDGYEEYLVEQCNNLAQALREQGLKNNQIFSQDREFNISISSWLIHESSNIPFHEENPHFHDTQPTYDEPLKLICKKWTGFGDTQGSQELTAEETIHTVVHSALTIRETSGYTGACKVSLSGVVQTRLPNAPVRFKYRHTSDHGQTFKWSQPYEVTTDHSKTAMFSHEFDVPNREGEENGGIAIVGMEPEFTSNISQYVMNCKEPATSSLGISRPPKVSMDYVGTGKIMVGKHLCPTSLRLHGVIEGYGSYVGNAIFFGDSYLSNKIPYKIQDGQTKHISARRSISWGNSGIAGSSTLASGTVTGNEPKYKVISLGLNLTDYDNNVIASVPRRDYRIECTIPKFTPGTTGSGELGVEPRSPTSKQPSKKFGGMPPQVQPQVVPKIPADKTIQPKQMKIIKQKQ